MKENKWLDSALKAIRNMSEEDKAMYFPKDTKPKGWISIEDHLPMMLDIVYIK